MLFLRKFFLLSFILLLSSPVLAQEGLSGIVIVSQLKRSSYTYDLKTTQYTDQCVSNVRSPESGMTYRKICFTGPSEVTTPIPMEQSIYYFNVLVEDRIYHASYQAFWTFLKKPLFMEGQALSFNLNSKKNKMQIELANGKKIKARLLKIEITDETVIEKAQSLAKHYQRNQEAGQSF